MRKNYSIKEVSESIFINDVALVAEDNSRLLLEQYKMLVDVANKITERFEASNTFFITSNSFIVPITGFFVKDLDFTLGKTVFITLILFIGLVMSISWARVANHYKRTSTMNYLIIQAIEQRFPSRPFAFKYQVENAEYASKRTNAIVYIESVIPKLFLSIYIAGILAIVFTFLMIRI